MMDVGILAIGGGCCGAAAGIAAQYGRLCTFAAIEDALIAHDLRRARAWALATGIAILATQLLAFSGAIEIAKSPYSAPRLELLALVTGALLFGFGMALVGTCGFGLLVRAGSGDLKALLTAVVLGMAAFAATAGPLSTLRIPLSQTGVLWLGSAGDGALGTHLGKWVGTGVAAGVALVISSALVAFSISSARVRKKPRLLIAAVLLGLAVAGGWVVTGVLGDPFDTQRLESLTFVAPIGRVLLVIMGERVSSAEFAVISVFGVLFGSLLVAALRRELRWEAFDDQREMRRHLLGGVLMGIGGVLAKGCTIGQGLSAASTLAISAPIAIAGMVIGARLGLAYLMGRHSQGAKSPALVKSQCPTQRLRGVLRHMGRALTLTAWQATLSCQLAAGMWLEANDMQKSSDWLPQFPGLGRLPEDLLIRLKQSSNVISLPAGSRIYGPGQAPESSCFCSRARCACSRSRRAVGRSCSTASRPVKAAR